MSKPFRRLAPGGRVTRFETDRARGFADDFAHFFERGQFAAGADLHEEIAHGSRFHRPGDDRAFTGVRCELIQDGALRTAAHDVNDFDAIAREFFEAAKHLAILQCQAFVGATDEFALGLRNRLSRAAAEILDGLRHVRRIEEAWVIGIDQRAQCRARAAWRASAA